MVSPVLTAVSVSTLQGASPDNLSCESADLSEPSSRSAAQGPSLSPVGSSEPSSSKEFKHSLLSWGEYKISQLASSTRGLFKLQGFIADRPAVFLLDSGATGNFVSSAFVAEHQLVTSPLHQQDVVLLADGSEQKTSALVPQATVKVNSYIDKFDLVALPLSGYDAIIGMPWLDHYNPNIDWRARRLLFKDKNQVEHQLSGIEFLEAAANNLKKKFELNVVSKRQLQRQLKAKEVEWCCAVYPTSEARLLYVNKLERSGPRSELHRDQPAAGG